MVVKDIDIILIGVCDVIKDNVKELCGMKK